MKEKAIHKEFKENNIVSTIGKVKVLENEFKLFSINSILNQKHYDDEFEGPAVGRIDTIFKIKNTTYISEIKSAHSGQANWYATKILAYFQYYLFQNEIEKTINRKYKTVPAIILPISDITAENIFICDKLKISLFSYHKSDNKHYIELHTEK